LIVFGLVVLGEVLTGRAGRGRIYV